MPPKQPAAAKKAAAATGTKSISSDEGSGGITVTAQIIVDSDSNHYKGLHIKLVSDTISYSSISKVCLT